MLGLGDALANIRANEGEAATHGIFFDDTVYDYMQHMKGIGEEHEEGVSATLIEAPRKNDLKGKGRAAKKETDGGIVLREAQEQQGEATYKDFLESTVGEEGLRPDMDPALREVLEALEDDAYVEDDGSAAGEDDFIHELIEGKGGDDDSYRGSTGDDIWGDEEDDLDPDSAYSSQVAKFKKGKGAGDSDDEFEDDEDDDDDEDRDTIADLRAASARRPPRAKTGGSMASASAFSMSSSSMFRNEGLSTLDDRFDQVSQRTCVLRMAWTRRLDVEPLTHSVSLRPPAQIEAMYEDSDEDESEPDEDEELPPQLVKVMDEFLTDYQILGGKMKPVLEGATGPEQLGNLRANFSKLNVLESAKRQEAEEQRKKRLGINDDPVMAVIGDKEKKWDVETVLSTYSNLENHPKVLRVQKTLDGRSNRKKGPGSEASSAASAAPARIQIDPKTGFPVVLAAGMDTIGKRSIEAADAPYDQDESDADSDVTMDAEGINESNKRQTIARSKDETPEQKKARKQEVKKERQARRQEKKGTKEVFGNERKRQQKMKAGKLRDAADIGKDNARGIEVMRLS